MPEPTTTALAEEQRRAELERVSLRADIKAATTRQDNHEARCEEHYQGIRSDFNEMKGRMSTMDGKLDGILTAQATNAAVAAAAISHGRPKWWVQLAGGAVLALIGWMASTIWSMETAKVDALQSRPPAAVTVNTPVAPVAPPVAVPETPLLPAPPDPTAP